MAECSLHLHFHGKAKQQLAKGMGEDGKKQQYWKIVRKTENILKVYYLFDFLSSPQLEKQKRT